MKKRLQVKVGAWIEVQYDDDVNLNEFISRIKECEDIQDLQRLDGYDYWDFPGEDNHLFKLIKGERTIWVGNSEGEEYV